MSECQANYLSLPLNFSKMAREPDKRGDKRNDKSRSRDKKTGSNRSGWNKPDGTPLRKRKGEFFPDDEIARKKSRKAAAAGNNRFRDDQPNRERDRDRPDRESNESRKFGDTGIAGSGKESFNNRSDENRRTGSKSSFNEYRRGSGRDQESRSRNKSDNRERRPYTRGEPASDNKDGGTESSNELKRDKPGYSSRGHKPKPFEKKRERYADRDHSKEMRGRFDKPARGARNGPHRERKPKKSADPSVQGAVRLNRYIANAGICSRREADDLITAGVISINGEIITELGTKVQPGDVVKFHDQTLKTERPVYVLLNKPKDFITTTDDPDERKTVMNLVKDACRERIFPVGRLDRNTTGLLLITNDGELTKRLTHPSSNIKKIYQVELDRNLTQADMLQAAEGVMLDDGKAGFDEIHYSTTDDKNIIGVELHSGKNRVVRRIFESLGYKVKKLDRTVFAGLTKKDLPRGRWRFLTEMEVSMLKMMTGKK